MVLQKQLDLSKARFWINLSSIASFFGNSGQTDYGAANAFLDHQAKVLSRELAYGKSMLWGPWQKVGMASEEKVRRMMEARGIVSVDPEEGVRLFARELEDSTDPVVAFCGSADSLPGQGYPTDRNR